MAVDIQVVRFQKTTAGSNGQTQDVNLNFTPKAVIVISECGTGDNTFTNHHGFSYGFSDGTNSACVSVASEDNVGVSDSGRVHFNNRVFARLDTATPTSVVSAASITFSTNKVTFTWNTQDAVGTYIGLIAIGGSDIANTKVNTVDIGTTSTGNRDYTGLGFNVTGPNGILFTLTGDVTTSNTGTDGASIGYCAAVSSSKRVGQATAAEDGQGTSDTWRLNTDSNALVNLDSASGAIDYAADFVSWITDGFRLNITSAAASTTEKFSYLVINGGTWDCGTETGRLTTGTKSTTVSVSSNTLRGLMTYGSEQGLANYNTVGIECRNSVGMSDGTNEFCAASYDEDNQNTAASQSRNSATNRVYNVVIFQNSTSSNNFLDADFSSFGTNQFTLNHTVVQSASDQRAFMWIVVADGAVISQVSTSKTHKFNILGKVTNAKTHKWNIIAKVTSSKTHKFNIFKIATKTATHKFNIIAKLTPASRTHKYNILQGITESNTHKFSILNTVSRTRTHKYNILEQIVKSAVHVYNVIGKVVESNTHKYNVIGKVTSTKTHKYNILERISTTKTHVFSVLNSVTTSKTHKYNIEHGIVTTKTHLFDIISKVVVAKTHVYDVIGKIIQPTTHKYDITGTCSTSTTHKYNIISAIAAAQRTHKYNIESDTTVTKTTTHKYNILESVSTTKTHLFSILEQISTLKTHVFSVLEQIISNKTHKFNIIQRIEAQRTHPFSILNAISTVKTHLFDILEPISATTTHKYNIIGKLTTNKTHKYNVESATTRVEKTTTHIYDVEAATTPVSVEKTHIFDILQQITTTNTHRWAIIAKITKSFTHKYDTISTIGNTATHKYNIIGKLSLVFRTHIFNVLEAIDTKTTTHKYNILNAVEPRNRTHKYNIIGKITKTTTHKYGLGGLVTRTSTHRYVLGEFIFKELGGSTHAMIRFPERVRILDILGDINNKAIANIEIFDLGPANLAIGTVQLADYPFNVLTASAYKPRHRIASSLIIPPIIDTIENQAVAHHIAIAILEPTRQSLISLQSQVRLLSQQPTRIHLTSLTQIRQEEKSIIKVSASTQHKENDKVVNVAAIMIPPNLNLNKIVIPEIWSLEREKTLKTIVKLLKTEDLFE